MFFNCFAFSHLFGITFWDGCCYGKEVWVDLILKKLKYHWTIDQQFFFFSGLWQLGEQSSCFP